MELRSATDPTTTDAHGWLSALALIGNPLQVVAALALLPWPDPEKESPPTRRTRWLTVITLTHQAPSRWRTAESGR